ncbi:MAG: dihydrolipoamide acetyltransferase family protein [Solirubrobacterales bacterium]
MDVVMPRLSDSMEEGTVLRWLKQVGDRVERGDELVEIETDKANMTYEALDAGVLVEILAQEGDTLPIGEPIARIAAQGEEASTLPPGQPRAEAPPTNSPEGPAGGPRSAAVQTSPSSATSERIKASPVARRMAGEKQIELGRLRGTGPGGRIVKADVESALGADGARRARARTRPTNSPEGPAGGSPGAPAPTHGTVEGAKGGTEVVELTKLQATIARRMAESKATVPHFYLESEVDMSEAVKVRDQLKRMASEDSAVPTYNDMIVKACALALREFRRANGAYRDGRVELYSRVNVGIAVASADALVVPTLFDADRKSLGEIAAEAVQLAARVRDGSITPPELSGGTFTVSNLGMLGVTSFAAVINPPQAALLAVGALQRRPMADQQTGEIAARHMMNVTLACDHRILYGADGARFLARVRELLEQPLALAL